MQLRLYATLTLVAMIGSACAKRVPEPSGVFSHSMVIAGSSRARSTSKRSDTDVESRSDWRPAAPAIALPALQTAIGRLRSARSVVN
jgi:hypothetical protein